MVSRSGVVYGVTRVALRRPVVGLTASVTTVEFAWPEESVPVIRHDALVGLLAVQIAVTPVKPLDV
jgi:hypothetical protein